MAIGEISGPDALSPGFTAPAGDIEADDGEKQADRDGTADIGEKLGGAGRAGIEHAVLLNCG